MIQECPIPNFTNLGVSHSPLSLELAKIWPFMAKTWSSHGPSNWLFLNHNHCTQGSSMPNFTILGVSHSPLFLEMAKYGPFMAKTWSSHGPSNWFFLNHNLRAQGCSLPNLTILGVSHSALFLEMAQIWPFYGHNMVLTWSFQLVLPESLSMYPGMLHAKFQSPSIYIDRYFQLCDSVSHSVSQSLSQSVSDGVRCRAVHLARGQGHS